MSFQTEIAFSSLWHGLKNCQPTDRGMRPRYGEAEEEDEAMKSVVLPLWMLLNTSKICKSFVNSEKHLQMLTWKFHVETD